MEAGKEEVSFTFFFLKAVFAKVKGKLCRTGLFFYFYGRVLNIKSLFGLCLEGYCVRDEFERDECDEDEDGFSEGFLREAGDCFFSDECAKECGDEKEGDEEVVGGGEESFGKVNGEAGEVDGKGNGCSGCKVGFFFGAVCGEECAAQGASGADESCKESAQGAADEGVLDCWLK